jgi:hypothetical protein
MQLAKLNAYISEYKVWLKSAKSLPNSYLWETQAHFQAHWNLDTPDLAGMYERAIDNTTTRRHWQEDLWYPKRMMHCFIKLDPIGSKWMFTDLFDETKQAAHRMDRAIFFCDTMLTEYRRTHQSTKENDHFHADYRMLSLYLALQYPDTYVPYHFTLMQASLTKLASLDIPEHHDAERFFKVCRTIYTLLEKDGEILPLIQAKLDTRKHFTGKNLMPAYDFCCFIAER